ncbi:side tail fiber domain protein [Escherichia coli DEC5D]|nr:side tail fiber domain protein [Escherichia coli DEC5D]
MTAESFHQQNDAVLTVLNVHAVTTGFIRISEATVFTTTVLLVRLAFS